MFAPLGWLKGPGARRVYRSIEASGQFDATWYRRTYLRRAPLVDPLWHYLDHGWQQGFDPSPFFDTSHYVESSSDVDASGANPLFHYIEYGHNERRSPVRSPLQTLHHFFPQAAPLPMFFTPSLEHDRFTVVIDEFTPAVSNKASEGLWKLVLNSALLDGRDLRVLCRVKDFSAATEDFEQARHLLSFPSNRVQVVDARGHGPRASYPLGADEHFLATSWTSARAISTLASPTHLWWVEEDSTTSEIVPLQTVNAMLPTQSPAESNSPAQDSLTVLSRSPAEFSSQVRVLIFTDPAYRFAFCHTMRELEDLILRDAPLGEMLAGEVRGKHVAPIALAEKPLLTGEIVDAAYDVVVNISRRTVDHPRVIDVLDGGGNPRRDLALQLAEEFASVRQRLGAMA